MKGLVRAVGVAVLAATAGAFSTGVGVLAPSRGAVQQLRPAPCAGARVRGQGAPAILRLQCKATKKEKDPWGGRLGSMGSSATDGYGVLQDIIGGLSRESGYASWKDLFMNIDEDQSGLLDADEMERALSKLAGRVTEEQVGLVMRTLDGDKNGLVSYAEFVSALELIEAKIEQELTANDVMNDPDF